MNVRAVIFDIYKTLLEVAPPPSDAPDRWNQLWLSTFNAKPSKRLEDFNTACEEAILRENSAARALGIVNPEIYWPEITQRALPELSSLSIEDRDLFLYRHAQLQRTVSLMAGAGEVLNRFAKSQLLLGIASNSQPYTLRELEAALSMATLQANIFRKDLSFYSFDCGFSKPNPHAFRILTARLKALGVLPGEILMVGDRWDNDIAPARAAGWQTWQINGAGENAGGWNVFLSSGIVALG